MCELFCLASRLPTVATLSLQRFAERGGLDHRLIDGWGIALFDGSDVRLYREPEPARDSPWLDFIRSRRMAARLIVSHIRHATHGAVSLANTQPFVREIAGRMHGFAHNGRLDSAELHHAARLGRFHPLGDTDSEWAACALFERMARLWEGTGPPALGERLEAVSCFAAQMRELGPANFLYSDSLNVFAHGHRRTQADGRIAPPGLWRLDHRCDVDRDALLEAGIYLDGNLQHITLLASVPLTAEHWQPMREGEVIAV